MRKAQSYIFQWGLRALAFGIVGKVLYHFFLNKKIADSKRQQLVNSKYKKQETSEKQGELKNHERGASDLKVDSVQKKVSKSYLSDIEVNAIIEPRFSKIHTEKGVKTTAFFIDDKRQFLLTCYHLMEAEKVINVQKLILGMVFFVTAKVLQEPQQQGGEHESGSSTNILPLIQAGKAMISSISEPNPTGNAIRDSHDRSRLLNAEYQDGSFIANIYIPSDQDIGTLKNYRYFDLLILKEQSNNPFEEKLTISQEIHFLKNGDPLLIGERIYLGGYPLTQDQYTFTTGIIASHSVEESMIESVVIEAPVAPGNSGSAVFIQRFGQLYLIGIVSSAVAHIPEELQEMRGELKPSSPGKNEQALSLKLDKISEVLFRNLITGKAKVVVLRENSIYHLLDPMLQLPDVESPKAIFLIPGLSATKKSLSERLFQYINRNNRQLTIDQMLKFIFFHPDILTKFSLQSHSDIQKILIEDVDKEKNFVEFKEQLNQDEQLNLSRVKIGIDPSTPTNMRKIFQNGMQSLYAYAYWISKKRLKDNVLQERGELWEEVKINKNAHYTPKFDGHHISENIKELSAEKCLAILHERKKDNSFFNTNTVVTGEAVRQDLNDEVKQDFIKQAYMIFASQAANAGMVLETFWILTVGKYKMITFNQEDADKRQIQKIPEIKEEFYYGVIRNRNGFFMHHFESSKSYMSIDGCRYQLMCREPAPEELSSIAKGELIMFVFKQEQWFIHFTHDRQGVVVAEVKVVAHINLLAGILGKNTQGCYVNAENLVEVRKIAAVFDSRTSIYPPYQEGVVKDVPVVYRFKSL